ncbi:uncharacterized protein MELLADRAFT_110445 [Melampsora larici-populina 98AG31]|uniref:Uncharacterized protein n=1 Tax=Melampsora larici-populina (strain 98AG31 / pathotype 3-4-7) TaxID=747676 RepID=F4RZU3_MELLP|nr:uncharacterized protein MELLADRAFT_110445 [Melampsora larici-populina 98AG31]EGG02129.1 hypothetical protein MELLADRAFT_110445 [Melampsora larici-populina 98AG31]
MSAEESQRIACQALQAYSSTPGTQDETPSVISILSSYQRDGNGDAGLLLAILEAKRMEDERLAARDNLEAARLRAQHPLRPSLNMPSSPPAPSDMAICVASLPEPVAHVKPVDGTVRPHTSASTPSTSCPVASTNSKKRCRESPKDKISSHETVTRQDVNAALLAKIARSDVTNPKRPTTSLPASIPSSSIPKRLPRRRPISSSSIRAPSSSSGHSPLANTPEGSPISHHASPPTLTPTCDSAQLPAKDLTTEGVAEQEIHVWLRVKAQIATGLEDEKNEEICHIWELARSVMSSAHIAHAPDLYNFESSWV